MKRQLILLMIFLSSGVMAQNDSYSKVDDIVWLEQQLNSKSNLIHTISSDFVQEKHLDFLDDIITSKGRFWFKKENQLRWEYINPYNYIIALNNGRFIIKDGQNTSEYDIKSNKAFQEINDLIINSVKGTLLQQDKFTITAYKNASFYLVKLIPKDQMMREILSEIELYFDIEDMNIAKVKMIETQQDYTIISFVNRKLNAEIPASIFDID